jgi:serine/threonine-protein kinase
MLTLRKKTKKIFIKILFIGILFFIFTILMDRLVMPWYVNLGHEIEMPDVIELSVDEASSVLNKHHFSIILADSVFDPNLAKGTIVEQNPYPFAVVKKGRNVYLTVSIGKKPIIMPSLFYKSPRDAELILISYELSLRNKLYEYNDAAVEGVVIGQSYPQGQNIKKGSEVDITISLGPFPKVRVIPDLVGKSLQSAKMQLESMGVNKILIEYEERDDLVPNTVLKQSLTKGMAVQPEMSIELLVSKISSEKE